jgi:hypothetical protein
MAFGRKQADEDVQPRGRFVVDHVPVMISGKKLLQQKLDEGDAKGWTMRQLISSDKHDWILIVWERPVGA